MESHDQLVALYDLDIILVPGPAPELAKLGGEADLREAGGQAAALPNPVPVHSSVIGGSQASKRAATHCSTPRSSVQVCVGARACVMLSQDVSIHTCHAYKHTTILMYFTNLIANTMLPLCIEVLGKHNST
eukprot:1139781-Pelagomonas_calceolata.AAC.1